MRENLLFMDDLFFFFLPSTQAPRPQAHEDGADEFSEGGSVDGL